MNTELLAKFKEILSKRDEDTYYKWYYNTYVVPYGSLRQPYTNTERDILNCSSIYARKSLGLL